MIVLNVNKKNLIRTLEIKLLIDNFKNSNLISCNVTETFNYNK
jgi:hypothetical protein